MQRFTKLLIIIFGLCLAALTNAQENRDLLTNFYTRKFVSESVSKNNSWIKYPSYYDRESWEELPETLKLNTIKTGEKYLGYEWPQITATMYLEFTRTGDRAIVDQAISSRSLALRSLVFAELIEGKKRFIDDIINGVFAYCEQTYWGASAHFYMYGFKGEIANPLKVIPDIQDPIIDLFAGDVAADLSWVHYFFNEEFDKISPIISERLKSELQEKILNPFYERYDYWWITGWGVGSVNNWNPWCNYNILTCILLIEDDPQKKQDGIYKTLQSVDLFINSYPADGGCDEGPSYWGVAAGKLFDFLDLLRVNTNNKIDIFDNELIKDMGRYIYRVYIGNGNYYINFADAPLQIYHDPSKIYRFGKSIDDQDLQAFGAFLMKESGFENNPISGRIGEAMEALFNSEGWQNINYKEPLISEYYFPDLDIAIGRDKAGTTKGFYFAAKGGNNGEGHNHNDVGSFILYYNGEPTLIDVGVGTYTKETFSSDRYNIWTMQSTYHNLPVINGFPQSPGSKYKASNSTYNATKLTVSFSVDIANAYPKEVKVEKWLRDYTLRRGKEMLIKDSFALSESFAETELHFMTPLDCILVSPGQIGLAGESFTLTMNYKPSEYNANVQEITIDDTQLKRTIGNKLFMIVLKTKGEKTGNYTISLKEK